MAFYNFASSLRRTLPTRIFSASLKQSAKDRLQCENLPEKPKKPLTPYFRFLRDFRHQLVPTSTATKPVDIVRMGAADWAKANVTIKSKYKEEYNAEMVDYSKRMTDYTAKLSSDQQQLIREYAAERSVAKKKRELRKKNRLMEKPKRPMGPYMHFLVEQAKTTPKSMVQLMAEQKGTWKLLRDEQKARYVQLYEDDRKRYDAEMFDWEQQMLAAGHTELVRQATLHKGSKSEVMQRVDKLNLFKPSK